MTSFSFADIYSSAHFSIDPAMMALRQKSADKLLANLSKTDRLGLVRLHYRLPDIAFAERLVNVFHEDDNTFSAVGNQRELVILSTALLAAAIEQGDSAAALAVVTGSFAGARAAEVCPELGEWAKTKLHAAALDQSARMRLPLGFSAPQKGGASALIEAWAPGPDLPRLVPIVRQLDQESIAGSSALTELVKAAEEIDSKVEGLRGELEMLWWQVGGYSSLLEVPYADLAKPAVPILAGAELASLTRTTIGRAAVGALIQLRLRDCKVKKSLEVSETVDAAISVGFPAPKDRATDSVEDLVPLHTSLDLSRTVGAGMAWHEGLKKKAGLSASLVRTSLEFGMQMYRETLMLTWLAAI